MVILLYHWLIRLHQFHSPALFFPELSHFCIPHHSFFQLFLLDSMRNINRSLLPSLSYLLLFTTHLSSLIPLATFLPSLSHFSLPFLNLCRPSSSIPPAFSYNYRNHFILNVTSLYTECDDTLYRMWRHCIPHVTKLYPLSCFLATLIFFHLLYLVRLQTNSSTSSLA